MRNVALHTEGVDRNQMYTTPSGDVAAVALHTEGVDRNLQISGPQFHRVAVALHTEGVDRNEKLGVNAKAEIGRPPHGGRG